MGKSLQPEPLLAAELAQWAETAPPGLAVTECSGRNICRLEWRPDPAARLSGTPLPDVGHALALGSAAVLRTSPVSALAVSDTLAPQDLANLYAIDDTACVDVSHGFVVLTLAGSVARALLDGLVPADLEISALRAGRLRRTQVAGHGVMIHCLEDNRFDLYVDRSLAWSLWRFLRSRPMPCRG